MPKPPLPDELQALLREPNPAVMTTLQPRRPARVRPATWYLWDDGRVLVNMDEGRVRLKHLRDDPRVSLTVLDEGGWYTHLTVIGRAVVTSSEDTGLARDRPAVAATTWARRTSRRHRRRYSAWIEIDRMARVERREVVSAAHGASAASPSPFSSPFGGNSAPAAARSRTPTGEEAERPKRSKRHARTAPSSSTPRCETASSRRASR